MRGIVACLRGVGEEIRIAILEFEVLDPPGTPEGFDLGFGKFHELVRQNAQGAYRLGKRCRAHFVPRLDEDAFLGEARAAHGYRTSLPAPQSEGHRVY